MSGLRMLLIVSLLVFGALPAIAQEAATADELQDLYSQAKMKFRSGLDALSDGDRRRGDVQLQEAAALFRSILDRGRIENGYLYYNIGNCYFWLDDLGRAILNYRRAERTIPTDGDLRQNLHAARQKTTDRITKSTESRLLETVFFWHYAFPLRWKVQAALGLFLIGWAIAFVNLALRRKGLRILAGLVAFGFVVLAISCFVNWQGDADNRDGVIVAAETTARKGDGESYEPAFEEPLHAGTEWQLVEERGDWVEVRLLDGRQCWLKRSEVEFV